MGLVGDITSAAGGLLGTGETTTAAITPVDPVFYKGDPLDPPEAAGPGAAAFGYANLFNLPLPIEFVHFGYVHPSTSDRFAHAEDDDTLVPAPDAPGPPPGRALAWRAALDREAVLLHGMILAARRLVEERAESAGAVEELMGAAASLMGGGGPAGPQPANLDPHLEAVAAAAGPGNVASLTYPIVHKVGFDLHQARANFRGAMPQLLQDALGNDPGAAMLGGLTDAVPLPNLPAVGDTLKFITGILFKLHDCHLAVFQGLRAALEPGIEEACRARTLAAIRGNYRPVYDVWSYQRPPDEPLPPDSPLLGVGPTGLSPIDDTVNTVNQTAQDVRDTVRDVQQAWENFWNTTPPSGPGEAELIAALGDPETITQALLDAFCPVFKLPQLPKPIEWVVKRFLEANIGMLQQVFLALQDPLAVSGLTAESFLAAARRWFRNRIEGLLRDVIPSFSVGPVNTDMLISKGGQTLDEQVGRFLNPVLNLTVGSLYEEFLRARNDALLGRHLVMETFLARYPLLLALLFRNSFFPFWQVVVDEVFGRIGAGAAMAASPVKNLLGSARNFVTDTARASEEMNQRVQNRAQGLASDIQNAEKSAVNSVAAATGGVVSLGSPLGGAAGGVADAVSGVSESLLGASVPGADADGGGGGFPGTVREPKAAGVALTRADWESVQADQATNPTDPPTEPAPAAAGGEAEGAAPPALPAAP